MVGTKRAVSSVQMVNGDVLFTLKKPEGVNLGLVVTAGESSVVSWCSGVCWTLCRSVSLRLFGGGCRSWQDCLPLHCQTCHSALVSAAGWCVAGRILDRSCSVDLQWLRLHHCADRGFRVHFKSIKMTVSYTASSEVVVKQLR